MADDRLFFQLGGRGSDLFSPTRYAGLLIQKGPHLEINISLAALLPYLKKYKVINEYDRQNIESARGEYLGVRELLAHLQRGDLARFDGFLRALWESNQKAVVKDLGFNREEPAPRYDFTDGSGSMYNFKDYIDDMFLTDENACVIKDHMNSIRPTLGTAIDFRPQLFARLVQQYVIDHTEKQRLKTRQVNEDISEALLDGLKTVGQFRRLLVCLIEDDQGFIIKNIGLTGDNVYKRN